MADVAMQKYLKDDDIDREALAARNVPTIMAALGLSEEEARAYVEWNPRAERPTTRPRCTPVAAGIDTAPA